MTQTALLFVFVLMLVTITNTIQLSQQTNHRIHSILHQWTQLNLQITFFPQHSSPILQHIQTDIKYTIQNLTKYIMIHPLQHYQHNLAIPAHCQYEGVQHHISLNQSEVKLYILSNLNNDDIDIHCQHKTDTCLSTTTDRLLFGVINLCNMRHTNYTQYITHTIHKLLHHQHSEHTQNHHINTHTPSHSRHLLSSTAVLSPQNKTEILSEINVLRSEGAMGNIELGSSGLFPFMRSTRMEAYIWDDALMDSAMLKASTCDVATPSLNATLSISYIANPSRIPIVDASMTYVGEILFNATQSLNFNNAIDEALEGWKEDCKLLDYTNIGCLAAAPSIQHCDNCRRLLAETARYIGCGFSDCGGGSIAVVCHIYYSTNIHNLAFPNPGFVPYFSPGGGGPVQCTNCPFDRNQSCDPLEGLCRGCASLNYEACEFGNDGVGSFCPPLPPELNCSETGVTTAAPTMSPTLAPTFSPTNTIGVLDIADLLDNVINFKRRRVAQGQVINFPGSAVGVRATNMESLIWDESLSITATNISLRCDNLHTNTTELGRLYRDTLTAMGTNSRVIVSSDSSNIFVGETMHIIAEWTDANNAAAQAFDSWENECDRFNFALNCSGSVSDPILCRNCLQLVWSKSRYIGCGLTGCPVINSVTDPGIDVYNSILFVCHWYWGADIFNFSGNTNWLRPFLHSGSDDFCQEMPFFVAGCNDTARNGCDDGLCDGCPHDNYHQCTTDIAFNQQEFGNEGCPLEPIQHTCTDGVTPTFSPTASPTFTEPDLNNVIGIANAFRSQIASGDIPAANMQAFVWHEPLAQSAYCTAATCDITPTDVDVLARRFQQSTTLTVSTNVDNVIIGELRFISLNWINAETSLIEALTSWFDQCTQQNYTFNVGCCKGTCSIFECSACLQMIWAQTRYIGCSYDSCLSMIDEDGVEQTDVLYVVCHFYFGANVTQSSGLIPYQVGLPCSNCPVDRKNCTLDQCTGCPADNWELCTISEPGTCDVSVPVPQNCTESGIPSPQHPEYTQCPSLSPTDSPTNTPSISPNLPPSTAPTLSPTISPTFAPTMPPTNKPTISPSNAPTVSPTNNPTFTPIVPPTNTPSMSPSVSPTDYPSTSPTFSPTNTPSTPPTIEPTSSPTKKPSISPSNAPTNTPSTSPTFSPTNTPSTPPTIQPSSSPTNKPSISPTFSPTNTPSISPSINPTYSPSVTPSFSPSVTPTHSPQFIPTTTNPTANPTDTPSDTPLDNPTNPPTQSPIESPTNTPSLSPTTIPPTNNPTTPPSNALTISPTNNPTRSPTIPPTNTPSMSPSVSPTNMPTMTPTNVPSFAPTLSPTNTPSFPPTNTPSISPSVPPTHSPQFIPTTNSPSNAPTNQPSQSPTNTPSNSPSSSTDNSSEAPSSSPSNTPTNIPISPSLTPTYSPTNTTTTTPSIAPSIQTPSAPSETPPTDKPSNAPSMHPTSAPSHTPTAFPTDAPIPSSTTYPPTPAPTCHPTPTPTDVPTPSPTASPSTFPFAVPTSFPVAFPTAVPNATPTWPLPTKKPTAKPNATTWPTKKPTAKSKPRSKSAYSSKKRHDILVAVDVCFATAHNDDSDYPQYGTFIVPYSGHIHGITLSYSSGGIYENAHAIKTNWGINEMLDLFCIHITDDKLQLLYPNLHTYGYDANCNNITNIPQYSPFSHSIKDETMYCLSQQSVTNYKLHFMDSNEKKFVNVEAGDILRIYWSDILFEKANDFDDELNGELCVDVMVYYYHVTDHRSKKHKSLDSNLYKKPYTTAKPIFSTSSLYESPFHDKKNQKKSDTSTKKFHWYWMQRYHSSFDH